MIPSFSMSQYRTYGEAVITMPLRHAVVEAACIAVVQRGRGSIWMMFVTAYGALIEDAKVGKGDFVLIPAASSSVGLATGEFSSPIVAEGDTGRADAHFGEETAATRCGGRACHRDLRGRPPEGGHADQ